VTTPPAGRRERSFARARDLMERTLRDVVQPTTFTLLDRQWRLLPGVFSPAHTPVTELFTQWLPYPAGGSFLEIGSGAGVIAVTAALSGCAEVTAVDLSHIAVENTRQNAELHDVGGTVRVLRSDLFDALESDARYDVVFWNSNFVLPPVGYTNETDFDYAFFDPAYETHRRFLNEAPDRVAAGGRVLLGFSDLGEQKLLGESAAATGRELVCLRSEVRQTEIAIEFQLLEVRRARSALG
jgi:release factor glutamine methyltransferase